MTPDALLEKFETFAEAPNAVEKVRQLALELAVCGRIVSPSDSSDPDLVAGISDERNTLKKAGERRIPKSFQAIEAEEWPWRIPSSWNWHRMAELFLFIDYRGKTPVKQTSGVRLLTAKNIKKGFLSLEPQEFISEATYKEWMTRGIPQDGDILFTTEAPLGHAAVLSLNEKVALAQRSIDLRPFGEIESKFVLLAICSPNFQTLLLTKATGMTATGIKSSRLKELPFPLPPLAEQKRIVAKVDELMALCDQLEAQQQERDAQHTALTRAAVARFTTEPTPTNLNLLFHKSYHIPPTDLRKTILTLAVQGKLVPQDPADVPVLDSIRKARLEADLPEKAVCSETPSDKSLQVPDSWLWVSVSDVARARLGKMLDKHKNSGEPHPYLRNTNVHWFRFELDSIKTMLFEPSELDEYRLEPGDVLICEGGHGIARTAVWANDIPDIMFQKALHRVRPLSCLDGHFLTYCLRVFEHDGVLQQYYTGAGIPHFTGRGLAKVRFPLPPLAEQRRIVAKVDQLMTLVDQLESQLAQSRTTAESLMAAVVAELTNVA